MHVGISNVSFPYKELININKHIFICIVYLSQHAVLTGLVHCVIHFVVKDCIYEMIRFHRRKGRN